MDGRETGLSHFVTEQPPYSLLVRGIEADVLPATERYGMGVLPWSPLAAGWLSGRYRKAGPRTTEHLESQLGAADVRLTTDVLDRIDEIVPPGVTLNRADAGYLPSALSNPATRRRPTP